MEVLRKFEIFKSRSTGLRSFLPLTIFVNRFFSFFLSLRRRYVNSEFHQRELNANLLFVQRGLVEKVSERAQ